MGHCITYPPPPTPIPKYTHLFIHIYCVQRIHPKQHSQAHTHIIFFHVLFLQSGVQSRVLSNDKRIKTVKMILICVSTHTHTHTGTPLHTNTHTGTHTHRRTPTQATPPHHHSPPPHRHRHTHTTHITHTHTQARAHAYTHTRTHTSLSRQSAPPQDTGRILSVGFRGVKVRMKTQQFLRQHHGQLRMALAQLLTAAESGDRASQSLSPWTPKWWQQPKQSNSVHFQGLFPTLQIYVMLDIMAWAGGARSGDVFHDPSWRVIIVMRPSHLATLISPLPPLPPPPHLHTHCQSWCVPPNGRPVLGVAPEVVQEGHDGAVDALSGGHADLPQQAPQCFTCGEGEVLKDKFSRSPTKDKLSRSPTKDKIIGH